ncbi:MAG TPA: formate dehydrogenase subunit alpha [Nitrospira sp.]|nr:formate dehydrogenase subunit alpha [Nitrospira sp.]
MPRPGSRSGGPAAMNISINDRSVTAEAGDTVYRAAARAGITIPSLCASSHLSPYGSCRLCIAEIEGMKGVHATCSLPVRDGMVVRTESESLARHRRNLIELYLSERPDGEALLQVTDLAKAYGVTHVRYPRGAERAAIRDESSPFFVFDNQRCISCARCVRACDEIQPAFAISMVEAGFGIRPAWGGERVGGEGAISSSTCVSCGACVKECPTGALTEKTVLRDGPPMTRVRTTCAYCGVGCAFDAGLRDGRIVSMVPSDNGPSNHGHACLKGRFGWTYNDAEDRVRTPLLRDGDRWKAIGWEQALDLVARSFGRLKQEAGPDAIAVISSSRGTNEENYLFSKFIRCVMGTNHIDNCARVCHSATVTGMMETLGASAATNSIRDLEDAKLILVVGANPTESHPVLGARLLQLARRGVPLIVADPRKTEVARAAVLHLQLKPGTNVALLNGLGHVIAQEGLLNRSFIAQRTEGIEDWLSTVRDYSPDTVERLTGVPADAIRRAARLYASSGASLCMHGLGVTEHRWGSHGVIALCNLALATGNIARPGTGINPLRGQNNVQGASDSGCLPTHFIGYQPLDDPTAAARHEAVTGRPLPSRRGMKIPEMWDAALQGRLKGLWIIGYDVAQTDPNLKKVRAALSQLDFLVVQDLFISQTARFAHLLLPGASFLEKDGTFTNLERRIQRIRKAVDPPNGILPDWRVVCEVSTRMGYPMRYDHPSEIMAEMASLSPMLAGVSYDRLEQPEGLQWPVLDKSHPGTPLMHRDRFARGKARFVGVDYLPPGEHASEEYPFILITGRLLEHYNCGAQTRRTPIIDLVDSDVLEMHPDDVTNLRLWPGRLVRLVSARSSALLPLVASDRVRRGEVFTTFHFPGTDLNSLLSSSADDSSKCPEYKVSAVRVEPVEPDEVDPAHEAAGRIHRRLGERP